MPVLVRRLFPLAASLLLATAALAANIPGSATVGGNKLVLNGKGMREATVFKVDVYEGALYLPSNQKDAGAILGADQPWQLDLHFVRDVSTQQMQEALDEGYKKNASGAAAAAGGMAKIGRMMTDVEDGDLMRFRYQPGKGTSVFIKGKKRGTVPGAGVAKALLSVWIGNKPPNAGLKRGLLGG